MHITVLKVYTGWISVGYHGWPNLWTVTHKTAFNKIIWLTKGPALALTNINTFDLNTLFFVFLVLGFELQGHIRSFYEVCVFWHRGDGAFG